MTNYELHPLCTLFPRLAGAEFEALREDIKANGLRQPIVLHDGMIIDGGNRYRACLEAGVEPRFAEFEGGNLVAFVLSANLHRRHMTPGQQAAIVASAQDWAKAQPAHRPEKAGNVAGLSTVAARAAESGASERTQRMADKVAKADPELARKVAHGEVSLPKAMEQIAPKSKAEPKPSETAATGDEFGPSAEEIAASERDLVDELESLRRVAESDDRIAAALAEANRFRAQVRVLQERVNGLMGEKNEQIRIIKSLRRKLAAAGVAA